MERERVKREQTTHPRRNEARLSPRLEGLRRSIRDGSYIIDTEAIAGAMLIECERAHLPPASRTYRGAN